MADIAGFVEKSTSPRNFQKGRYEGVILLYEGCPRDVVDHEKHATRDGSVMALDPRKWIEADDLVQYEKDLKTQQPKCTGKILCLKNAIKGRNPTRDDFEVQEVALAPLEWAECRVRTLWISCDPYQRELMDGLWIQDLYGVGKPDPTETAGGRECGTCVGIIEDSRCEGFEKGDLVRGKWGVSDHRVVHAADLETLRACASGRPTAALGALGQCGRAAYFGFAKILRPEKGNTVFISGGAGSVGSIVAQLCKAVGCVVIGSTRSPKKEKFMKSCGFDKVLSTVFPGGPPEYAEAIKHMAPKGIDAYFDTTGGEVSEGVWRNLNTGSRVAVCGQTSQYTARTNISSIWSRRGLCAGFMHLCGDPKDSLENLGFCSHVRAKLLAAHVHCGWEPAQQTWTFPEPDGRSVRWEAYCIKRFITEEGACDDAMGKLIDDGQLKYREETHEGSLEDWPDAFRRLFTGENEGKVVFALKENVKKFKKEIAAFKEKRAGEWKAYKEKSEPAEAPGLPPNVEPFEFTKHGGDEDDCDEDEPYRRYELDDKPPRRNLIKYNHVRGT